VGRVTPRRVQPHPEALAIDVLACPRCGRRMRLMATVHYPRLICAILAPWVSRAPDRAPGPARRSAPLHPDLSRSSLRVDHSHRTPLTGRARRPRGAPAQVRLPLATKPGQLHAASSYLRSCLFAQVDESAEH
jgi:hypothetical protein